MINSEVIRDQSMREGYEQRKAEYENRIREWLSEENRERFKDKELDEITADIGKEMLPIGEVPVEIQEYFGVNESYVYSSEAYFINHAINNHRELTNDEYFSILSVLENPDYAIRQTRNGVQNAILVKQIDGKWYEAIVGKDKETGKMIIYLTYFGGSTNQKKVAKRDASLEIKIKISPNRNKTNPYIICLFSSNNFLFMISSSHFFDPHTNIRNHF